MSERDAARTAAPLASAPLLAGRYAPGPVLWEDRPARVAVRSAVDTWLGDAVAVAVLDPTAEENPTAAFTARARAWSRFYQPGIMELRDLVTWKGAPLAVWDAPAGGTLAGLMASGVVGAGRVERMTAELGSALDVLAAHGIVHAHLHPGAIGLDEEGHARLLPWPAAAAPSGYGGASAWQAPEVLAGESPSPLSDRWSLGATGLSALVGTGPGPLDGAETKGLAGSLRRRTSAPLLSVLTTYMAPEPEDRRLGPALTGPVPAGLAPVRSLLAGAGAVASAAATRMVEAVAGRTGGTDRSSPRPDLLRRGPRRAWTGMAGIALAGAFLSVMPRAGAQPSGAAACPPCQPRSVVLAPPAAGPGVATAPAQLSEAAAVAPATATRSVGPSNGGGHTPTAAPPALHPASVARPALAAGPAPHVASASGAPAEGGAPRPNAHDGNQFRNRGHDGYSSSDSSAAFHSSHDQG